MCIGKCIFSDQIMFMVHIPFKLFHYIQGLSVEFLDFLAYKGAVMK